MTVNSSPFCENAVAISPNGTATSGARRNPKTNELAYWLGHVQRTASDPFGNCATRMWGRANTTGATGGTLFTSSGSEPASIS